jgi:nicotinate-nucleotide adenylyltransferase
MLALAIAGHTSFRVDELEKDRPGPSYTVDTLRELAGRHSGADWHFLMGSDSLPDLPHWRDPAGIFELATLLIVPRPGSEKLSSQTVLAKVIGETVGGKPRVQLVESPLIDIASSDLRRRVRAGQSIRFLVPAAVECYIRTHRLYQNEATPA